MIRWWVLSLQLAELFVSSLVHMLYGFYIFSSAVAGDLSQALNECLFKANNTNVVVKEDVPKGTSTNVDSLPPIVLVHGIFGFGKGVCEYFIILSNGFGLFFPFRAFYASKLIFLGFVLVNFFWAFRDWEVCRILLGRRRKTRGFWCLIWGL